MKRAIKAKTLILMLISIMLLLTACNRNKKDNLINDSTDSFSTSPTTAASEETEPTALEQSPYDDQYYESINRVSLILPDVKAIDAITDDWFDSFMEYGFTLSDIAGSRAYGEMANPEEYTYDPVVYDIADKTFKTISAEGLPTSNWVGPTLKSFFKTDTYTTGEAMAVKARAVKAKSC